MNDKHIIWIIPTILIIGFIVGYISAIKPLIVNNFNNDNYTIDIGNNLKDVMIQESKCGNLDNYVKVSGDDKFAVEDCNDLMNLYNTKCLIGG